MSYDALRVNLLVTLDPEPPGMGPTFHVDTLDLYSARQRAAFEKQAAHGAGPERRDDQARPRPGPAQAGGAPGGADPEDAGAEARRPSRSPTPTGMPRSTSCATPSLLDRILDDFESVRPRGRGHQQAHRPTSRPSRGSSTSRWPSSSSQLARPGSRRSWRPSSPSCPRRTGEVLGPDGPVALLHRRGQDLQHKILAIAEEEGAEKASYALKLLQSEGELSIASHRQGPADGPARHAGVPGRRAGDDLPDDDGHRDRRGAPQPLPRPDGRREPRADPAPSTSSSGERQTLDGLLARRDREARSLKLHRDAQRLLRPLLVDNPYAPELTFLDDRTRTRRDHVKYLDAHPTPSRFSTSTSGR